MATAVAVLSRKGSSVKAKPFRQTIKSNLHIIVVDNIRKYALRREMSREDLYISTERKISRERIWRIFSRDMGVKIYEEDLPIFAEALECKPDQLKIKEE